MEKPIAIEKKPTTQKKESKGSELIIFKLELPNGEIMSINRQYCTIKNGEVTINPDNLPTLQYRRGYIGKGIDKRRSELGIKSDQKKVVVKLVDAYELIDNGGVSCKASKD